MAHKAVAQGLASGHVPQLHGPVSAEAEAGRQLMEDVPD
jgi:hypothetical protein